MRKRTAASKGERAKHAGPPTNRTWGSRTVLRTIGCFSVYLCELKISGEWRSLRFARWTTTIQWWVSEHRSFLGFPIHSTKFGRPSRISNIAVIQLSTYSLWSTTRRQHCSVKESKVLRVRIPCVFIIISIGSLFLLPRPRCLTVHWLAYLFIVVSHDSSKLFRVVV